jgi:ADP-heptose:LPS heptosyltransferase
LGYAIHHKTASVWFGTGAGIGDALLLTPLIKELKRDGYHVTGIFTSTSHVHELYEQTDLLDEKIIVLTRPRLVWFIARYRFKRFDITFFNYFAGGKRNLLAAWQTSHEVRCNKKVEFKQQKHGLKFIEPKEGIHDGEQNLRLFQKNLTVKEEDFRISFHTTSVPFDLPEKYIVLQAGAGNNTTPYKVWDAKNWQMVLEVLLPQFPGLSVVLLGDKNETGIGEKLAHDRIIDLTGRTTLAEAITVLKKSQALIGTDSGLMHLAVALNKPTYTVWGASNEKLYSYEAFDPRRHLVIKNYKAECRPCSAWIGANTSRVSDPAGCPDFMCLSDLSPKMVHELLYQFLKQYLGNAE